MSSETRLREAIQDLVKQLRDQQAAALDAVVNTFVEAAATERDAEVVEARAQAEAAARETLEGCLSKAKAEALTQVAEARAKIAADAQQTLETSLADAKAQADAAIAHALKTARDEAATARADADAARDEVADARAETDKAREEAADARVEGEKALAAAVSEARAQGHKLLALERETDLAGLSRLLVAVRALDDARSLTDVLDALADHAAREADRVGVLLVSGDRLRGWRLVGFGEETPDAKSVELGLDDVGVIIVEAVRSKMSQIARSELSGFGFAPLPAGRAALAVPIEVGGRVVAVVYADDVAPESGTVPSAAAAPGTPSAWPAVVEILARHAGRCLEAVTVWHAAKAQPTVSSSPELETTAMGRAS